MLRVFTDNRELRHRAQAKSQRNSAAELWAIILSGLTALNWFGFSLFMILLSYSAANEICEQPVVFQWEYCAMPASLRAGQSRAVPQI